MVEFTTGDGVRFGRTVLGTIVGDLVDQPVEALVLPANIRGIMGAGMAGAVRLAGGPEIEQDAMRLAPLPLGGAVHTAPGALTDRGVAGIIHAVVFGSLGSPTTLAVVRRAVPAVLRVAAEQRYRSLAIPPIGSGNGPGQLPPRLVAEAIVMEVVAYLRRSAPRLDRCLFVSRSEDDTRAFADAIALARQHAWGQPE